MNSILIVKTGAAAMASATRGRKTTFKSSGQIKHSLRVDEYEEEIRDALYYARKSNGVSIASAVESAMIG